ncbi:MAG: DNA double-strand break repair nuclease NurA [Limnochordales bacterium]|nr:DNA double-strand break repair nuclease NurA [Limnochordales bacterium]
MAEDFGELPQALVEKLVAGSEELGEKVAELLGKVDSLRAEARERLQEEGLLRRVDELPPAPLPTVCGVDGAFGVEALVGHDLVVAVGVAVEGLTPPDERRYWPEPHFSHFLGVEPHRGENRLYARALMVAFELEQAAGAPHDVVLMDGSFVTPISALHQALSRSEQGQHFGGGKEKLFDKLLEVANSAVRHYHRVVAAQRTDKIWLSVPKYTSKREVGSRLQLDPELSDRALVSLLLRPGEFLGPVPLEQPSDPDWSGYYLSEKHLDAEARGLKEDLEEMLRDGIRVVYVRSTPGNPALRVEVPRAVAESDYRLSMALQALRWQSSVPGLLEPEPLYYADRMAKSLGVALPALRGVLTHEVLRSYPGEVSDVSLVLHGYRTEEE